MTEKDDQVVDCDSFAIIGVDGLEDALEDVA
eukprot:CAMPEP_0175838462 /NCGR_PEP_ID=MMETSP0107_2-20121207/18264_1 /TAXON_ID=195067 ORGANISM="Goniomonas pacifica, Strain CCMP1869" /NCGR_SAMPLE_ID=MMETSP0107_2 /ASSEMBLY_ACC=CAM_ASM_000203 /LENGTH=30 /DNA_ID= /DNA_START= /DNA_END= /DNA_ORIENTATION=